MAANYYPMVSSSPPPLDDGPSFEDDDGDEFGHFASATSFKDDLIVEKLDVNDGNATTKETLTRLNGLNAGPEFHISNGRPNGTDITTNGYGEGCDIIRETIQPSHSSDPTAEQPRSHESIPAGDGTERDEVLSSDHPERTCEDDSWGECTSSDDIVHSERTFEPVESSPETVECAKDGDVSVARHGDADADFPCNNESDEWNDGASQSWEEPVGPSDVPALVSNPDANFEGPKDCFEDANESAEERFGQFDESFDDFADFQTASASNFGEKFTENDSRDATNDEVNDDGGVANFAAFEEHGAELFPAQAEEWGLESSSETCKDEDEFGTFNSAYTEYSTEFSSYSEPVRPAVSAVLASVFPESSLDRPDVLVEKLDEVLKDSSTQNDSKALKNLWTQLHDIDNTQALTYHWNHSQSNKKLLHSLRIDTRNFLAGTKWNSSVPLFAATLGSNPLEPKKATFAAGEGENSKSPSAAAAPKLGCAQESTVPPAQFDWGSSGLVNPLDDSASSALLDLDFFLTNDIYSVHSAAASSSSSRHINSLETEFLGSGPNSADSKAPSIVLNNSPILDKIMSQAARSATASSASFYAPTRHRASDLSAEAVHVLDSLPDLSFMRAKVLMFPIRGSLT